MRHAPDISPPFMHIERVLPHKDTIIDEKKQKCSKQV